MNFDFQGSFLGNIKGTSTLVANNFLKTFTFLKESKCSIKSSSQEIEKLYLEKLVKFSLPP